MRVMTGAFPTGDATGPLRKELPSNLKSQSDELREGRGPFERDHLSARGGRESILGKDGCGRRKGRRR